MGEERREGQDVSGFGCGGRYASTEQAASDTKGRGVRTEIDNTAQVEQKIDEAEVIAVRSLGRYSACTVCESKVEVVDDVVGCCSKCGMQQLLNRCKGELKAKLCITSAETAHQLGCEGFFDMYAFESHLCEICEQAKVI